MVRLEALSMLPVRREYVRMAVRLLWSWNDGCVYSWGRDAVMFLRSGLCGLRCRSVVVVGSMKVLGGKLMFFLFAALFE